jgi:hypothetical protein
MFGRSKTQSVKDNAASGKELALALAHDKQFRKQLASAIGHGLVARRRAAGRFGLAAAAARLAADQELRRELAAATESLQVAWSRVEKKRSHRLRNTLLVVGGAAGALAAFKLRSKLPFGDNADGGETGPIHEEPIESRDAVSAGTAEPQP